MPCFFALVETPVSCARVLVGVCTESVSSVFAELKRFYPVENLTLRFRSEYEIEEDLEFSHSFYSELCEAF